VGSYDKVGMKGNSGRIIDVAVLEKKEKDRKRDKKQVWIRCVVPE
jgi:hypothetical protein